MNSPSREPILTPAAGNYKLHSAAAPASKSPNISRKGRKEKDSELGVLGVLARLLRNQPFATTCSNQNSITLLESMPKEITRPELDLFNLSRIICQDFYESFSLSHIAQIIHPDFVVLE